MSQKSKKQSKVSFKGKKKIITIAAVVVLLVAGLGAGMLFHWWQTGGSNGNGGNSGDTTSNGEGDALTQNNLPSAVKDAQDTASTAGPDESNKQIAVSLPGASNDEKFELYLQQGVNYENESKWNDALASYKSAEAIQKTSNVYESLGRVEENLGDKTQAITYYKQAVTLLNQNSPMYSSYKQQLQDKITALGG